MPVADIPVHPKTREDHTARWGCWNREDFKPVVFGAACYGSQQWPFVMSNACKNDIRANDPKCTGCRRAG